MESLSLTLLVPVFNVESAELPNGQQLHLADKMLALKQTSSDAVSLIYMLSIILLRRVRVASKVGGAYDVRTIQNQIQLFDL